MRRSPARLVHRAAREGYDAATVAACARCGPRSPTGCWFASPGPADDRGRPSYSTRTIDLMLHVVGVSAKRSLVAEVGAGTGKFLSALLAGAADRGLELDATAVEPVPAMRRALRAGVPECRVVGGAAEDLGAVPRGAFHAVFCAQAFHWFASLAALREIRRVLDPCGTLCLVWNTRDDTVPWVRDLDTRVIAPLYGPDVPRQQTGDWKRVFPPAVAEGWPFGPLESAHLRSAHVTPERAVVDRVLSLSVAGTLPTAEKAALADRVRAVLARPDVERDPATGCVVLPYRTDVYWARPAEQLPADAGSRL